MTKNDLQAIVACVEVAQQSGKIAMNAMLRVGIAVQSAQMLMDKMEPSDVLIVFAPEKKSDLEQGGSAEPSQKPPESE